MPDIPAAPELEPLAEFTQRAPAELTARANAFEAALGSATRYRAGAVTSVALACGGHGPDIEARTLSVLAEQFARVVAPRVFNPQETTHGPA